METTTIIYIILAFVVGIVIGLVISCDHQIMFNVRNKVPPVSHRHTARTDTNDLVHYLEKRIVNTGRPLLMYRIPFKRAHSIDREVFGTYHTVLQEFMLFLATLGLQAEFHPFESNKKDNNNGTV